MIELLDLWNSYAAFYEINDLVVREILNGILFFLGLELCVAMGFRLSQRMKEPGWYNDDGTQAIIALFTFLIGECVRSGWIWALLGCQNEFGKHACTGIANSYALLGVSAVFAIVGATCCIRVFTKKALRPWTWIAAGILAISIPIVLRSI